MQISYNLKDELLNNMKTKDKLYIYIHFFFNNQQTFELLYMNLNKIDKYFIIKYFRYLQKFYDFIDKNEEK